MSQTNTLNATSLAYLNDHQPLPLFARLAVFIAVTWVKWTVRRRTRRALLNLDVHLLNDIGLSRGVAYTEARRPFWRA